MLLTDLMTTSTLQITSLTYEVDFRVNICGTIICPNSLFFPSFYKWRFMTSNHIFFLPIRIICYCLINHPKTYWLRTSFVILWCGSLGWLGLAGQFGVRVFPAVSVSHRIRRKPMASSHRAWLVCGSAGTVEAGLASVRFRVVHFSFLTTWWSWGVRLQRHCSKRPRLKL